MMKYRYNNHNIHEITMYQHDNNYNSNNDNYNNDMIAIIHQYNVNSYITTTIISMRRRLLLPTFRKGGCNGNRV